MAWFRRRRDAEPEPEQDQQDEVAPGESPAELAARLGELVRTINARSGQLTAAGVVAARRLTDTLGEIIGTSTVRPLDVYTLLTLRGALEDYLPTTLQTYLSVAPDLRTARRPSGGTPAASFLEQLVALQSAASATLVAARDQDADALMTQGAFLRTKFSGSDLDL